MSHIHEWVSGWQKCEPSYRWSESQQWPDDIPSIGCRVCYTPAFTLALAVDSQREDLLAALAERRIFSRGDLESAIHEWVSGVVA
jgi:hypothetical protein